MQELGVRAERALRVVLVVSVVGTIGCAPSGGAAAGVTVHDCAEAMAAARGHVPSCNWAGHPCATDILCDAPLTDCMVDLGNCVPDTLVCDMGHLVTYNASGDCQLDAFLHGHDAALDAGPPVDAHFEPPDLGPPEDANGVHSCAEYWARVGPTPCLSASGTCDAGVACDGFERCTFCPYQIDCDPYHHGITISIAMPGWGCDDAGP